MSSAVRLLLSHENPAVPTLVLDIGVALIAAGLFAVILTRFKVPTVAAYLLAGLVLGPVTGIISDQISINTIAQLGLLLLLFLIGLEIDVRELIAGGRTIIVSGVLQYPLTVVLGLLITQGMVLAGLATGILGGTYAGLYLGLTMAGSSTLLVVAMFQQSFTLDTVTGRVCLIRRSRSDARRVGAP